MKYSEAFEEFVADSMEKMLTDQNAVEKLAMLRTKDKSVFDKLRESIQKLVDRIKQEYAKLTPDSAEGRTVATMTDVFSDIQDLFLEALDDASNNFQKAEKNTITNDGVKYSMAGVYSKTYDNSLALKAEQMLFSGVDSETVRQETGWYKGYDGEWRYEIDDSKCELIENPNLKKHEDEIVGTYFTGKVSDVLNHNDLFEAYPQLKDIKIVIQPTDVGLRGRYEGGSEKYIILNLELFKRHTKEYDDIIKNGTTEIKSIEQTPEYKEYNKWHTDDDLLNMDAEEWLVEEDKAREKFYSSELGKRYYYLKWGKKDIQTHEFGWSKSAKEVLMHELQHAIQEIEGFTGGSTLEYWQRKLDSGFAIKSAEQKDDLKNAEKEYYAIMKKDPYFFSVMNELVKSKPNVPRGKIDFNTFEKVEEDPVEWQRYDEIRSSLEKEYGSKAVMDFLRISDKVKNLRDESYTAEEAYMQTAGEVEARDTARRLNLNAEQRKNTRPDIDRKDIVFADYSSISSSIEYTEDNKPVVIVENNILEGIPKSQWIDTVKNTISSKFSQGIPISGKLIKVNLITRKEFTNSKTTQHYRRYEKQIYKDKFKSANNLDEIILASTNYVNEDLKHERNDKFIEFARGDVLMRIGNNDYSAKVVVGFTSGQQMVLYDVVDFTNTSFNIKKVDTHTAQMQNAQSSRTSVSTNNSVPQENTTVNNNSMQENENNTQKKFSLRENVEETKDLVAVHNLSAEKLLKSLNLGGLPMPSIAIMKAKDGHNQFGDISLVFRKDTIDPEADKSKHKGTVLLCLMNPTTKLNILH